MEILLRQIPNAFEAKTAYFEENKNKIEALILGSSHTMYGVNPDFLSSEALNFSNVSQTLDIDYTYLQYLGGQMPKLRYVIIRLSYTTLFEQLSLLEDKWRIKDYNIYGPKRLDFQLNHQFEILSVKLRTNINRILSYYVFKDFKIDFSKKGWGVGRIDKELSLIDLEESGMSAAKRHTILDQHLYSENLRFLTHILEYCKSKRIKVLLVTTPTHESYYSNLESEQLKLTIDIGERMERMYSNCYYYNLLSSELFSGKDFLDGDHLNAEGATKLSKFLNQKIINFHEESKNKD
ncbi:hypothetical protein RBH94_01965 [Aestuariibaculum sp. YM273]|uniref:hypothetical protein n=1 Tax=Aestuariibaculum sp. YM273 TaxID=3070659 RepID=UPI0027DB158E|nr:hypothetical protein [Aestuariibaculum sp. YM273]WMI65934.1 hypothetical protein RBH94_01965 [Aestuariibaculum sp. YM273]